MYESISNDILKFCFISEKGLRDTNEDCFLAEKINDFFVFAVADGIGGHAGGELASKIAISELKEFLKRKGYNNLIEGFKKANSTIVSQNEKRNSNMGTTLVLCIVNRKNKEIVIANVGDSRAYLFNDTIFKTKDHSLVQELVQKGVINTEEVADHPQKNILSRALGLKQEIEVDVFHKKEPISEILLCSDGLSDYVSDEVIAEITKNNKTKIACDKLVKKALKNGSKDNITVIIAKFND
jgi:PPM family protein phosphatase